MSTTSPAARTWRQDFDRVCFRFVPQLILSLLFWLGILLAFLSIAKVFLHLLMPEPTVVSS